VTASLDDGGLTVEAPTRIAAHKLVAWFERDILDTTPDAKRLCVVVRPPDPGT